ncbi:MAG: hypothetical protein FWD68_14255 [Alphaproteobacteria bacterium]|nr:hypothetical protein [Alphaproteobacteria bacterium]
MGILGVDKQGEEFCQITLGGRADETTRLGQLLGPAVRFADVADVLEKIVEAGLAFRERPGETFAEVVTRLGIEPFRECLHATG